MGPWDCYCAICGGPFSNIAVSDKPRTAAFRWRRAKEIENQRRGGSCPYRVDYEAEADDDERVSPERYEEDHTYDRDVIRAEKVQWAKTLHVLALNFGSQRASK